MPRVAQHGNSILTSLCTSAGALAACVRDESSPMTWWQSRGGRRVLCQAALDHLLEEALVEISDKPLRSGQRLRLCRDDTPPFGFAYSFAGIYIALVVFDAPFNRFIAEPHLRLALPLLERLVPRLPPLDDDRTGVEGTGRARSARRPRSV
ncbi:MAG: hypothetical protein ABIJ09_23445 [Pseudomonadota bacterium]